MKPKTIVLAIVAVVCGLGAMWMTNRLLAEKQKETPEKEPREKVLVAKAKIPAQTVIKDVEKYFEEKERVAADIPPQAIRTADKIIGKRLSRALGEGETVSPEVLVNPASDGLGAVLPAGMRAVTIRIQPDSSVAGFVLPKSHVDVLCTVRNSEGSTTYTILENMEVLAIDTKPNREASDQPSIVGTTATLAANPDDCNLLKMAANTGTLDLILRPIGDDTRTKTKPVDGGAFKNPPSHGDGNSEDGGVAGNGQSLPPLPPLAQGTNPTPPAAVVEAPPEEDVFVMTMIIGPNVEKVTFRKKKGDPWGADSASSSKGTSGTPAPAAPATPAPAPAVRNPLNS